ncbi:hypothetical protein ROHU_021347 [Labeo rohita]|uniref:Uncharacterized protein n=1 Tax=Labeo rohita TaxID=84645 RepID=A0A498MYW4_LABRO|nr:hypothetical protein ROHU_021347 [Labeo rohita]
MYEYETYRANQTPRKTCPTLWHEAAVITVLLVDRCSNHERSQRNITALSPISCQRRSRSCDVLGCYGHKKRVHRYDTSNLEQTDCNGTRLTLRRQPQKDKAALIFAVIVARLKQTNEEIRSPPEAQENAARAGMPAEAPANYQAPLHD